MISFDGRTDVDDILAVAANQAPAAITEPARARVRAAAAAADVLCSRIPTYGRSTGVGANRLTSIDDTDRDHGLRLLRSHATDAGEPIPPVAVRAMLAVRLAQLIQGGSGVRLEVVDALVAMLNANALPTVLQHGGIGTADLAALAATALTLQGEWPASRDFHPTAPWPTGDALAFMSSSALTIGRGCLALADIETSVRALTVSFALTFVALDGNPSAFSAAAARAAAAPGAEDIAQDVRELVGSVLMSPARIQDPYGLRAFVVSTAPVRDAVARLRLCLETLINTAQENPLFVLEGDGEVVHHAAFFQATLGVTVDALNLALAQTTPVTFSRIRMMNEPEFTGVRPFLADGPAGASGTMMLEYAAASAIAELRHAAQPASLLTTVLSRGTEEDASFATQAVSQLESTAAALRVLIACELVESVRLLRQRGTSPATLPPRLAAAMDLLSALPAGFDDRSLREDIAAAEILIPPLAAV